MAVVLAAVGLFLYLRLEAAARRVDRHGLRSRASEIAALARRSGGRLPGTRPNPLVEQDESFAQILERGGSIVDSTPSSAARPS